MAAPDDAKSAAGETRDADASEAPDALTDDSSDDGSGDAVASQEVRDARDASATDDARDSSLMRDAEAGGDADAAGDAGDYHPCPTDGAACVIMPLGDSITYGFDSSTGGGYRLRLLHDIWTARHDATFVGSSTSGPAQLDGKPFPKNNEGHNAYTIDPAPTVMRSGISPLVPASLAKYAPDIVTLMIGTNDLGTNNDVAGAPARLAKLIDTITTMSPRVLLVLAQITPTGDDNLNALIRTYNAALPALVRSRVAAGKHLLLVDMYTAFTSHAAYRTDYMNGSLHPNDAGYDVMGDVWYAALAAHL